MLRRGSLSGSCRFGKVGDGAADYEQAAPVHWWGDPGTDEGARAAGPPRRVPAVCVLGQAAAPPRVRKTPADGRHVPR